jgi:hypothetical protein
LNDITGLDRIPDSFGVVLSYTNGNGREARVEFMKGDLMFVVHMGSPSTDYSAQAVHQALLEYGSANAPTVTQRPAANRGLMVAGGIAIGGVVVATALILLLLAVIRPWHRQSSAGVRLSPDGRYWWDGTTWRPTGSGP